MLALRRLLLVFGVPQLNQASLPAVALFAQTHQVMFLSRVLALRRLTLIILFYETFSLFVLPVAASFAKTL